MSHSCPGEPCAVCRWCQEVFEAVDEIYMRVVETVLSVLHDIRKSHSQNETEDEEEKMLNNVAGDEDGSREKPF